MSVEEEHPHPSLDIPDAWTRSLPYAAEVEHSQPNLDLTDASRTSKSLTKATEKEFQQLNLSLPVIPSIPSSQTPSQSLSVDSQAIEPGKNDIKW